MGQCKRRRSRDDKAMQVWLPYISILKPNQLKSIWVRDFSPAVLSSSVTVQDKSKPNLCLWPFFTEPKTGTFSQGSTLQDIFCQYKKVQVERFLRHRKIKLLQLSHSANAEVRAFHWRISEMSAYNTIYRRKLEHQHNSNKKLFLFSKNKHNLYKNNSNGFFSVILRQNFTFFLFPIVLTYTFHAYYEHTCNSV